MIDAPLNSELVTQSINFHGQQLQKLWEGERGESDLANMAVKLDFSSFQQRQKTLNFQDRTKRLKLQQFIAKRASSLFDLSFTEGHFESRKGSGEDEIYSVLPPYDTFLPLDRSNRVRHFFQNVKLGNIAIGTIVSKTSAGLVLRVLSLEEDDRVRYVSDLQIKAFCPVSNLIPAVDKKKVSRTYLLNDAVCCEVIEVVPEAEKLILGMKGNMLPPGSDQHARLGLTFSEDFPDVFRRVQDSNGESYDTLLKRNIAFNNPGNISYLATSMGLQPNKNYSHILGLRQRFPEQEYATELRQVQASKWAFRSVADGIEHFKSGRHTEAFQCLNKALDIDPRNIEGLVARGALYANSGSFQKAIDDFEASLKLNPNHQNARKYMGETLVALGRSFEDESKTDEALKAYEKCLSIVPYHEEASNSLQFLKKKMLDVPVLPGLTPAKTLEVKETVKQLLRVEQEEEENHATKRERKSKKKKDRKSRKRRHRSSSTSSSSSTDSSGSSSSSSTSSSSSSGSSRSGSSRSRSHSRKERKKRRKSKSKGKDEREKSLSPLSKRMALMDSSDPDGLSSKKLPHCNQPSQSSTIPFNISGPALHIPTSLPPKETSEYELQVRKFLEHTKGDLDYEDRVRKFLEETARWRKDKKVPDDKSSKKKKKKEKKSHDKDKSKKKKDRKKHKKSRSSDHADKNADKSDNEDLTRKLDSSIPHRLPKHIVDAEEEFLYGTPGAAAHQARELAAREVAPVDNKNALRMLSLDSLSGLDDLQSKLNAYYAQVEKDTGLSKRHSTGSKGMEKVGKSPKLMMDDFSSDEMRHRDKRSSASPPRSSAIMSAKWKMQIPSVGSVLKKKETKMEVSKETWDDPEDRQADLKSDDDFPTKKSMGSADKSLMGRKFMDKGRMDDMKLRPKDEDGSPELGSRQTGMGRGRKNLRRQSRESYSRSNSSGSERRKSGSRPKARDRSRSRSSTSSRSRSRGRKYSRGSSASSSKSDGKKRSSTSPQAKKSGSADRYRSRSRSYSGSRSRSRSHDRRSYYSRSRSYDSRRSRSPGYRRSRSPDRRRDYHKYQGRFQRGRGTYYRPRFQNFKNQRGNYVPRGRGFYQKYPQNRGRGFVPRMRGRGRGRFNNYYKPGFRDYRNYDRRGRSHDRDSRDRGSSYEDDPMRKVHAEKDRINKYIEESGGKEDSRSKGTKNDPLSEGEERDDDDYGEQPPSGTPDEGHNFRGNHWKNQEKWEDKEKEEGETGEDVEDMDKFFSKVKASKELKSGKVASKEPW